MAGLIVHEWIESSGGAEKVLDAMASTYGDASVFCLWNDAPERFPGRPVAESWLSRTPLRRRKALALPFMPTAWGRVDVDVPDWILVSSHLFAHHVTVRGFDGDVFVYVHTPARYLWTPELDERGSSLPVRIAAPWFRRLDRKKARRPDRHFAANSRFVRDRIQAAWQVDAEVIYPPVEVERIQATDWVEFLTADEREILEGLPDTFIIGASRFVPYKRLDQVIRAGEAANVPVVIAGSGQEESALRQLALRASVDVRFVIAPSDALLYSMIERASAFVFPPVEDFGILPVEAMALGTPAVVNALGGASESVEDGISGIHVRDFTNTAELRSALARAPQLSGDAPRMRSRAFSSETFSQRIRLWTGVD